MKAPRLSGSLFVTWKWWERKTHSENEGPGVSSENLGVGDGQRRTWLLWALHPWDDGIGVLKNPLTSAHDTKGLEPWGMPREGVKPLEVSKVERVRNNSGLTGARLRARTRPGAFQKAVVEHSHKMRSESCPWTSVCYGGGDL